MFVIVSNSSSNIQVWGEFELDTFFGNYVIGSSSNNEIYLLVNSGDFSRGMKASGFGNSNGSAASEEVTLRLSKKDNMPVLALTVNGLTRHSHTIKLVQYIPATLLSQDQKEQLKEPLLSDPQVHILLPNLLALKQIADKIKQLHTRLTISANMNGCLSLKTSTIGVDVVVSFKDLANPELDPTQVDVNAHPSRVRDKDAFADVTVDVRDFIKFVQMYSTNPTNVVCCLVEGFGVVFYVYVGKPGGGGGGTLTFYIPHRAE